MKPQETILKEKQMSFLTSKSKLPVHQRTELAELTQLMVDSIEGHVSPSPFITELRPHWPSLSLNCTKLPPASGLVHVSVSLCEKFSPWVQLANSHPSRWSQPNVSPLERPCLAAQMRVGSLHGLSFHLLL